MLSALTALLRSRKFLVAVATVIGCVLAEFGMDAPEKTIQGLVMLGSAVILGIAGEDMATKHKNNDKSID